MKTRIESFEDIVFENRNKNYGAYELRTKYAKRGTFALFISVSLFSFAVAGPLIANMLEKRDFITIIDNNTGVDFERPPVDKPEIKLPEPPPETSDVKKIIFIAPKIVDELTEPDEIFNTNDEWAENANSSEIDTTEKVRYVEKTKDDLDEDTKIELITDIQEKPMFPGGDSELLKYIAKNTIYPTAAIEGGIEGTVYIRFVVTKSGKIGKTIVLRAVDPLLEAEALKVVKSLPAWTPGKNNGEPVNVWFIVPVKFELK